MNEYPCALTSDSEVTKSLKQVQVKVLQKICTFPGQLKKAIWLYLVLIVLLTQVSQGKTLVSNPLRSQVLLAATTKVAHEAQDTAHLQSAGNTVSGWVGDMWKGPGHPPGSIGLKLSEPGRDYGSSKQYLHLDDFWYEFGRNKKMEKDSWHQKVESQYDTVASDVSQFLAKHDNEAQDYVESKALIDKLQALGLRTNYAIDIGAGIGRVSLNVLTKIFAKTDLLEPSHPHIQAARKNLEVVKDKTGEFYEIGLQDFNYERKYDLIWMQAVLSFFTDEEVVRILKKAKTNLMTGGFILVKEYSTQPGTGFIYAEFLMSMCRSDEYLRQLFKRAGLRITIQENTAYEDLSKIEAPLRSYALRPE